MEKNDSLKLSRKMMGAMALLVSFLYLQAQTFTYAGFTYNITSSTTALHRLEVKLLHIAPI